MSDQLDQQLASLIEAAKSAGQDAFAFIQQQAPDFFDQLVRWRLIESAAMAVALFTMAGVGLWLIFRGIAWGKRHGWAGGEIPMICGGLIALIVGLGAGGVNARKAGQAYFAPKVLVIEEVAKLVRR